MRFLLRMIHKLLYRIVSKNKCTYVHISVKKGCIVRYLSIALWDSWNGSILNPIPLEFIFRKHENIFAFSIICNIQVVEFLTEVKDLRILHNKYHGCWCPGELPGQGICNHGIDLVLIEYNDLSTRGIRGDSRFVPSQWERVLFCNDVSHWLGTSLESVLWINNGDTETETGMCELSESKYLGHG